MLQYREQQKMSGDRFHIDRGDLNISTESVNITVVPGEVAEGSFTVSGPEGQTLNGFVLADKMPMQVVTETFSGQEDQISYRFDASTLDAGERIDGFFRILSNRGEYSLPYTVQVSAIELQSSLGVMQGLFHFTNLARTNWKEACGLFYSDHFDTIFSDNEQKEKTIWKGLKIRSGNEQNVEEFLISIGRKQPVEYIPAVKQITMELTGMDREEVPGRLDIRKNGWGYTSLRVVPDAPFLLGNQREYVAEDFADGSCSYHYSIAPDCLHAGLNLGRILLITPFETTEIPVQVRYASQTALRTLHHRDRKQTIVRMMQEYIAYREQKIGGKEFLARMGSLITRLAGEDRNNPLTSLYKIHYLISARRFEDAHWDLQSLNKVLSGLDEELPVYSIAQFDLEDDTTYAYRMYLTALCAQQEQQTPGDEIRAREASMDAIHCIEDMHKRNPENFWITWLLMYASEEYRKRPSKAWEMLRLAFEDGTRSPILYLEAYQMVTMNPAVLHELGDFELQTLLYAARHKILTTSVMTQVNYLAMRQKVFSARLYHVLTKGYELDTLDSSRDETLESICALLIRGNEFGSQYFSWYQKGVDRQLPVTRLFEYYMLSMPADFRGEVPRMAVMYFAYQSTLPFERNAYLYRYVLEHREDFPEAFGQYQSQIDQFTLDQLMQHKVSVDLGYLYETYLTGRRVLTQEIIDSAIPAIFTVCLTVEDPTIRRVVLRYEMCRSEQYFPVEDGVCYLPLYQNDCRLFFEDDYGNRFCGSVKYDWKRIMNVERVLEVLSQYEVDSFGWNLYHTSLGTSKITPKSSIGLRRLAGSREITNTCRQELFRQLLDYFAAQDDIRHMDEYLQQISPEGLDGRGRAVIIGYMVRRGMQKTALKWVRTYGTNHLDGRTILSLIKQALKSGGQNDDPAFAAIVYQAFLKGNYDEDVLRYLGAYFDGLTEELEKIRLASVGYGTDPYVLCKRMLVQMLYTGRHLETREDIIACYEKGGADPDLLANVLAQASHRYFVDLVKMGDPLFERIADYGRGGVPLVDICRIAWLKNRSEKSGEISDTEMEVTSLFLQDLMDQDIIFPFFRQFIGILPELQAFADETLVEYKDAQGRSSLHIVYHYAMEKNGLREKYQIREMKEMYDGVYVTGFLLFFGEQMQYYITDDPQEKHIVESGTVGQDARIPEESNDRFGFVNSISMLTALGRDEEALDKIDQYARKAFLVETIFNEDKEQDHVI